MLKGCLTSWYLILKQLVDAVATSGNSTAVGGGSNTRILTAENYGSWHRTRDNQLDFKANSIASIFMLAVTNTGSDSDLAARVGLLADVLSYALNHPTMMDPFRMHTPNAAMAAVGSIAHAKARAEFPSILNIENFIAAIRTSYNDIDARSDHFEAQVSSAGGVTPDAPMSYIRGQPYRAPGADSQGYNIQTGGFAVSAYTPLEDLRRRVHAAIFGSQEVGNAGGAGGQVITSGFLMSRSHPDGNLDGVPDWADGDKVSFLTFNANPLWAPVHYDRNGTALAAAWGWSNSTQLEEVTQENFRDLSQLQF